MLIYKKFFGHEGGMMRTFFKQSIGSLVLFSIFFYSHSYASTAPATPFVFTPYLYIGGQLGWAHSNWSDFINTDAENSGVVYGGKLGYQITRRFGAEAGGFVLPKSDQTPNGTVKSWVGYGAATFRFPLLKDESLFLRGKVGAAYRELDHDGELYQGVGEGHYWTAILGASLNYAFNFTHPLILGVEYSNIFGSRDSWSSDGHINADAAPSVQIVTGTLSVAFKL